MQEYCLIGHPLGHSISAQIHNRLFELRDLAGSYKLLDMEPGCFESDFSKLRTLDGFNVTIPYKQRIIPFLDSLSERACSYGAVNTVKNESGKLIGHNTDAEGFLRALDAADIPLGGRTLLCGAGGAASMMACEALAHGCSLIIAARKAEQAEQLRVRLSRLFPDAEMETAALNKVNGSFDLILNGTPVGMYPNEDASPVSSSVAGNAKAVFDVIYNPGETKLLRDARTGGARTQGGLPMLVGQAAAAQKIWNGSSFKKEEILMVCQEMGRLIEKSF